MGRAYRRWLIAKGNVFCPSGAAIAKLVERLRKEGWIGDGKGGVARWAVEVDDPRGKSAGTAKTPNPIDGAWIDDPDRVDLVLSWPAARAPLAATAGAAAADVEIQIHRGDDFIYPRAEHIGKIATECNCGEDLAFAWDPDEIVPPFGEALGIFTECSECSRTFDPARFEAPVLDPVTGRTTSVRGGAAHRFALVVAASLGDRPSEGAPPISSDLVASCEAEFNRNFYEIGSLE